MTFAKLLVLEDTCLSYAHHGMPSRNYMNKTQCCLYNICIVIATGRRQSMLYQQSCCFQEDTARPLLYAYHGMPRNCIPYSACTTPGTGIIITTCILQATQCNRLPWVRGVVVICGLVFDAEEQCLLHV